MLKNLIIPFILLCAGCHPLAPDARRCDRPNLPPADQSNAVENHLGQPVAWATVAFPIPVVVDPGVRRARKQIIQEAIDMWNRDVGLTVFVYSVGPRTDQEHTIWVTEENLPQSVCGNQLYGLAYRYFQKDFLGTPTNIVRGFIRLHLGVPDDRILSTTAHELGHILGLNHDREANSLMYPYSAADRLTITDEDIEHVASMILGRVRTSLDFKLLL